MRTGYTQDSTQRIFASAPERCINAWNRRSSMTHLAHMLIAPALANVTAIGASTSDHRVVGLRFRSGIQPRLASCFDAAQIQSIATGVSRKPRMAAEERLSSVGTRDAGTRELARSMRNAILLILGLATCFIMMVALETYALADGARRAPVASSPTPAAIPSPPLAAPASSPSAPTPPGRPQYVGSPVCQACHFQENQDFTKTLMGNLFMLHPRDESQRLGCEGCHGPGSLHVASGGKSTAAMVTFRKNSGESVAAENAVCLQCHQRGEQAFWSAGTHAFRGVGCVDCHTIMKKLSPNYQLASAQQANLFIITRPETQVCLNCHLRKRMQINLPSHMPLREGLMVCTDCHNPHGGPYQHMLRQATVNETCYTCHAEMRGPFLWPHLPALQNCDNCHDPHGSIVQQMLKIRQPLLCQQCHVGIFHPGGPAGRGTVFVFNRSCTNCHSQIHGSNSPVGRDFTR
jgi:DmsE family decaheme c-type cytochrome